MLARRGSVRLSVARAKSYSVGTYVHPRLDVWLEGKHHLVYDEYDGPNFIEPALAECHLYFKRSYEPARVAAHASSQKIVPLGLNYLVYAAGDFWIRRALWSLPRQPPFRPALRQWLRSSGPLSRIFNVDNGRSDSRVENFEGTPGVNQNPRVQLFTRAWDPAHVSDNPAQVEARHAMNHMRAGCIRKLRLAFGDDFSGGFVPGQYARERFPDCLAPDARLTRKRAFIHLVHQTDICVTSLGLQDSNGFRLAEYVAAARAIVGERMRHSLPGDFEAGKNYLDFTTPDECVAAAQALFEDPARRYAMMQRNQDYYRAYIRPDALVWNTLQQGAGAADGRHDYQDNAG